jgi:hypothetical protein
MLSLKWTLMLAAAGYVALVAFLYLTQRSMLYHPRTMHVTPAAAGLPATEEVVETSDGEKVILWHVPPRHDQPVVIYFPGNAEIIAMRAEHHRALITDGIGLIALSYRGYMGSTRSPTEPGLLHDAEAAYRFAAARYAPQRIVLWGIRSGPASRSRSRPPIRSESLSWRRPSPRPSISRRGSFRWCRCDG